MCFYHCAKFQHCPYLRSEKQNKKMITRMCFFPTSGVLTHFFLLLFSCFEVSLLKKFITSVIQELFSSNNFFLAQKSIQFDPETSLYPPTLAFSSATSLKLITENWRQAPVGVSGVRFVYVRVKVITQSQFQKLTEMTQWRKSWRIRHHWTICFYKMKLWVLTHRLSIK